MSWVLSCVVDNVVGIDDVGRGGRLLEGVMGFNSSVLEEDEDDDVTDLLRAKLESPEDPLHFRIDLIS